MRTLRNVLLRHLLPRGTIELLKRCGGDGVTRKEYITELLQTYDLVRALSRREADDEVLFLCHKTQGRQLVVRSYRTPVVAYEQLKCLKHPHVPEVFDNLTFPDGQVVLEEYISGTALSDVLEKTTFSYRNARRLMCEIGSALMTLHAMSVVHRDVKPENVLITDDGRAVLLDLNASRVHCSEKSNDTTVLGTIGYAPPEQFGISQSDATADVYALGVLLNVLLTGCHPSERLARGRAGKLVLKCTQIDPKLRFR